MLDNIGTPYSGINLSSARARRSPRPTATSSSRSSRTTSPTAEYVREAARDAAAPSTPAATFFFLAPDISTQVLNFGLAAPIDVQVVGRRQRGGQARVAKQIAARVRAIPGAVDVHLRRSRPVPSSTSTSTAPWRQQVGLTERDIAEQSAGLALASSSQVSPDVLARPKRGVQYLVAVQTPQSDDCAAGLEDISSTPLRPADAPQLLQLLRPCRRTRRAGRVDHHDITPRLDIYGTSQGTDLGSVCRRGRQAGRRDEPSCPAARSVASRARSRA